MGSKCLGSRLYLLTAYHQYWIFNRINFRSLETDLRIARIKLCELKRMANRKRHSGNAQRTRKGVNHINERTEHVSKGKWQEGKRKWVKKEGD
ncbi:hypothetical protein QQF64_013655 [Cirrhinus molitorella]|uniref:Ribosomal protein S13 n=1 Tax=Cirrhinus molitorella TaxID=172907 RepID=A0ABR3LV22_9TELE